MLSFRARALGAAVLIAAAAACVVAAPAGAAATKPYSVVVSPGTITEGVTINFQAKFTNNSGQTLGSANLTAPDGFSVHGASVGGQTQIVIGNQVQLRNLGIAPGASAIATVNATVPACRPASFTWDVMAKQSNDFNGTGNDFGPQVPPTSLTTSVTCTGGAGQCPPTCSPSAVDPATGASLDVTLAPGSIGVVTINVGGGIDCAGYDEILPNTDFSVDFLPDPGTGGGEKTVTLHFPKAAMQASPNNGVSFVNICFQAPFTFMAKTGSPAPEVAPGVFRGLLPDCVNPVARPCVSGRTGEGGGAAVTVLAPGGDQDPRYSG